MVKINKKNFLIVCGVIYSCSSFAHTYSGELEVNIFDYFKEKHAKTVYQLREGKEIYTLDLPNAIDKTSLLTGRFVLIEGKEIQGIKNKHIQVESIKLDEVKNASIPTALETRKILTLLVNFKDKKTTDTVKKAEVDSILYTGPLSMLLNYKLSSDNQLTFERDTNKDGAADIFVMNLNYDVGDSCDYNKWSEDAKELAISWGIDPTFYRHHMFVLPEDVGCSWGGLGNVGCGTSCKTWIRGYRASIPYGHLIYTHEIGHNLGLNHASTDTNNDGTIDSEYGDYSSFMGAGDYREANAPERDFMHWYDAYPKQIKTVNANGRFRIYPLEQTTENTNTLKVLKIKRTANTTYYISYRKNIGPFGMGSAYRDKINIHRITNGNTRTYFIKALSANQSFIDSANGVTIQVNQAGGSTGLVSVRIN